MYNPLKVIIKLFYYISITYFLLFAIFRSLMVRMSSTAALFFLISYFILIIIEWKKKGNSVKINDNVIDLLKLICQLILIYDCSIDFFDSVINSRNMTPSFSNIFFSYIPFPFFFLGIIISWMSIWNKWRQRKYGEY